MNINKKQKVTKGTIYDISPEELKIQDEMQYTKDGSYIRIDIEQKKSIPYFKNDNYNVQAYDRFLHARREHARSGKIDSSTSPCKNHLQKADKIIADILAKHQQAKYRLQKIRNEKRRAEEEEIKKIKFRPQICKSSRYYVNQSMLERSKSWDMQRLKNFATIKQQKIMSEFKECTFSPKMISKDKSTKILKQRQYNNSKKRRSDELNDQYSEEADASKKFMKIMYLKEVEQKKQNQKRSYSAVRNLIKHQIQRIPL